MAGMERWQAPYELSWINKDGACAWCQTQSLAWRFLGGGDRSPEQWACPSPWPEAHYPRRMWAGDTQGTRQGVRWETPGMVSQGSASGQFPSPL